MTMNPLNARRIGMISFDEPYGVFDEETHSYGFAWNPTPRELIQKQVAEAITNDREGKIRQALIELGWTPPAEEVSP